MIKYQVNTQTSLMQKIPNKAEEEPVSLNWAWRPENLDEAVLLGKGHLSANQLIDQKAMNDASDYVWYMTRYIYIYNSKSQIKLYTCLHKVL